MNKKNVKRYDINKSAAVGNEIICPVCGMGKSCTNNFRPRL